MPAPSRRRWFRFSLRGLLVVVTLASILLGWRIKTVRDVDRAIATLRQTGFSVIVFDDQDFRTHFARPYWRRILAGDGDVGFAVSQWGPPKSEGRAQIAALIEMDDSVISRSMPELHTLKRIRFLLLGGRGITDQALEDLKSLEALEELELHDTTTTRAGIDKFQRALPGCRVQVGPG